MNLCRQTEILVRAMSEELGISKDLLYRWIKKAEQEEKNGSASKDTNKEVARLQNESAETKLGRDILEKALSIFSKTHKGNCGISHA